MLNGVSPAPKIKSNHFGSNSVKGENKPVAKEGAKEVKTDKIEVSKKDNRQDQVQLNTYDVAALKKMANHTMDNLRRMVETLIARQGKTSQALDVAGLYKDGDITAADIEQARFAISDEGEFGVEAVSDRLVNFAIAISGDDKGKFEELKGAIQAGFEAARGALGGSLPDISNKTYDMTMQKLEAWANE